MRKKNAINQLVRICLDIAELVEENGDVYNDSFLDELGLGYRALTGYLRAGVKAVVELQSSYWHEKSMREIAEESEESARDVLEEIFCDRELDSLNDDDFQAIKVFCRELFKKWESEDETD